MAKLPTNKEIEKRWKSLLADCKKKGWLPTKDLWMVKLGISSRTTYNKWKKKVDTIKRTDIMIENAWVQRLGGNNVAGVIFYLKNAFQYKDNRGLDLGNKDDKPLEVSIKTTIDKIYGDSNGTNDTNG